MKVLVPRHSGFCPGVKTAEKEIFRQRENSGGAIYVFGELIHNKSYISHLRDNDIITARERSEIPPGAVTAIRTHGMDRGEEEQLRKSFEVIDLTCVKVKKLQELIRGFSDNGYHIVIAGKKDHPEVLGLISYAESFTVIENLRELDEYTGGLGEGKGYGKIAVVSQTTSPEELFDAVCAKIGAALPVGVEFKAVNSICPVTTLREQCAIGLQDGADITFVIGDEKSSNSKKLFEILKRRSDNTWFVEDLDGVKKVLSGGMELRPEMTALVVSSSSTPAFVEQKIRDFLLNI
ncbi:MAG: 4-hydroxy-3-methylbut-2-enyl diphosphate reductase [Spirochaetes bacterium GWF1_51_8]|nr:MAG: 4-hydroxy-3-methylbut-2-enyl diphosphate reductase [Spirochaetes bacterium GWF1_51_8]